LGLFSTCLRFRSFERLEIYAGESGYKSNSKKKKNLSSFAYDFLRTLNFRHEGQFNVRIVRRMKLREKGEGAETKVLLEKKNC